MTVDSGGGGGNGADLQWYFSQVKGTTDEEINEADIISTVEFNEDGELLATGDKGGRIVIFQREQPSKAQLQQQQAQNSTNAFYRSEYNVYSTFQSHEAEFDYLKSLEIEEKINKIKWLRRKNAAHFLLSTNDKTVKLWKIRERNKRSFLPTEGHVSSTSIYSSATSMYNGGDSSASANSLCVRDELNGYIRSVNLPVVKYMDRTEVEAVPKRVFANAHTYHINSISLNSDQETFMSADDLRINLWHIEITNQSFNIVDIKPANMEELAEVITAAEFHPKECNLFAYSSSRGTIRLCDMRQSALCDTQAKLFEEREDPSNKNFFSEIISSISDLKFSHSGRYLCTRDYLYVKVWDLNMENRPVEVYPVHDYLRSKLCILYENDCIFDKFECNWSPNDEHLLSGSYNNFFKSFNRSSKQDQMYECSREQIRPRQQLRPKRVVPSANTNGGLAGGTNGSSSPSLNAKRNNGNTMLNGGSAGAKGPMNTNGFFNSKDEVSLESLDLTKKILHTSWHPKDNIIAIAATNNLYLYYAKEAGSPNHHQTLYSNASSFMNSTSSSATSSFNNCVSGAGGVAAGGALNNNTNNNTNNTNNINNNSFNANRVQSQQADPSCLTLNTSFYTPSSTNNGTNSSTSLLTSSSSSTTNSTSNSSTTIPINGPIAATATVNSSPSNITTPAPLPLTTTNSMSL